MTSLIVVVLVVIHTWQHMDFAGKRHRKRNIPRQLETAPLFFVLATPDFSHLVKLFSPARLSCFDNPGSDGFVLENKWPIPRQKKGQLLPTKNNQIFWRISTKKNNPLVSITDCFVETLTWGSTGSLVLRAACSWGAPICVETKQLQNVEMQRRLCGVCFLIFFVLWFLFVVLNMFNMSNECLKDLVGHHRFGKWILKDLISSIILQSRSLDMMQLRRHRDE